MGIAHRIAGHRTVPHTADLRIEAWAATREECLAEAVRGLVGSFAVVAGRQPYRRDCCAMTARRDEDLLVAVVDEVIYRLDADGEIPVPAPAPFRASAVGSHYVARLYRCLTDLKRAGGPLLSPRRPDRRPRPAPRYGPFGPARASSRRGVLEERDRQRPR
jgi:SHS2 domain-containing protein